MPNVFGVWDAAADGSGFAARAILGGIWGTVPLDAIPEDDLIFTRGAVFPTRPTLGEFFIKTADNPEGRRGEYIAQPATLQGGQWVQSNAPSSATPGDDGFGQWTAQPFGSITGAGADWVAYSWSSGVGNGNYELGLKDVDAPDALWLYLQYDDDGTEIGQVALTNGVPDTINGIRLEIFNGDSIGDVDAAFTQTTRAIRCTLYLDSARNTEYEFPTARWQRLPDRQDIVNLLYGDFQGLNYRLAYGTDIDTALPPNEHTVPTIAQLLDSETDPTSSRLFTLRHDDRVVAPNPGRIVLKLAGSPSPLALAVYEQGTAGSVVSGNPNFIYSFGVGDAGSGTAIIYLSTINAVFQPDPLTLYAVFQVGSTTATARLTSYHPVEDVGETRWEFSIGSGFIPANWTPGAEVTITFFAGPSGATQAAINPATETAASNVWDEIGGGAGGQTGGGGLEWETVLDWESSAVGTQYAQDRFTETPVALAFDETIGLADLNKLLWIAVKVSTGSASDLVGSWSVPVLMQASDWRDVGAVADGTLQAAADSWTTAAFFTDGTPDAEIRMMLAKGPNGRLSLFANHGFHLQAAKILMLDSPAGGGGGATGQSGGQSLVQYVYLWKRAATEPPTSELTAAPPVWDGAGWAMIPAGWHDLPTGVPAGTGSIYRAITAAASTDGGGSYTLSSWTIVEETDYSTEYADDNSGTNAGPLPTGNTLYFRVRQDAGAWSSWVSLYDKSAWKEMINAPLNSAVARSVSVNPPVLESAVREFWIEIEKNNAYGQREFRRGAFVPQGTIPLQGESATMAGRNAALVTATSSRFDLGLSEDSLRTPSGPLADAKFILRGSGGYIRSLYMTEALVYSGATLRIFWR